MKVIVIGAGKKAEHFCDLFNLWSKLSQFYDSPLKEGEVKRGKKVDTTIPFSTDLVVYSAIGDCREKQSKIKHFKNRCLKYDIPYKWGTKIHPTAVVTNPTHIGEDFVIRELSSVGTKVRIGNHVSIGPLCNISHHSSLGDYVTIGGQTAMSGDVHIGNGVFIGQGAIFKPSVTVGEGAIIGAGAVVVKDIPPNTVVAGNPAMENPKFKRVDKWSQES